MKNIHLIPTDKSSRLFYSNNNSSLLLSKEPVSFRTFERSTQNIYITSDEEIKEGDWGLDLCEYLGLKYQPFKVDRATLKYANQECKKIILTTDQDLIKDGVQAIDDEFLEWFVKNPSCEYVTVYDGIFGDDRIWKKYIIIPQEEPKQSTVGKEFFESADKIITVYKQDIIQLIEDRILSEYKKHSASLPNEWAKIAAYKIYKSISDKMEEHKQETLEESAERIVKESVGLHYYGNETSLENLSRKEYVIKGAKMQAEQDREEIGLLQIELNHTKTLLQSCEKALEERDNQAKRMYSEEEVYNLLYNLACEVVQDYDHTPKKLDKWFEQFKKK
jgi:hypothetical protein